MAHRFDDLYLTCTLEFPAKMLDQIKLFKMAISPTVIFPGSIYKLKAFYIPLYLYIFILSSGTVAFGNMFNQFLMSDSALIICQFFLVTDLFFFFRIAGTGRICMCLNTLRKKSQMRAKLT